ncbi:ATP synthase subunit I [Lederbergia wuyishanensis]|uniref:ATP synthase protein I n=1 Tax=Lederbergia wuyishanensis TaxID=1347903 RepID=A0ABU0D3D8_9BACI|nr:ATP synthase subunit I [Lederbergia wuyishanensis]MCJ8007921.1 ATP synthase subunit I [Lederbergia wuyishanensis]MDQ0342912.1 ATP synthase protein I [Lederbergia wuyishanensis]
MPELQQLFNRHCKYIIYLIAIYVLGWGFTNYKTIFMGLILGTSVSLFNHWNLVRKTNLFGEVVSSGKKMRSFGTMIRMCSAILAVFIAGKYPNLFDLISVIIGIMTAHAVIIIDFVLQQIFKSHIKREER